MNAYLRGPATLLLVATVAACSTETVIHAASVGPPLTSSAEASAPAGTPAAVAPTFPRSRTVTSEIDPPFTVDTYDWEEWRGGTGTWFMLRQPAAAVGSSSAEVSFSAFTAEGGNPLGCEGIVNTGTGRSLESIIAAMAADPRLVTTAAGEISAGPSDGLFVDVQLAPGWTGTCADSRGRPALHVPSIVYLEGDARTRVILLGLAETILSINIRGKRPNSLERAVAAAMPIVETIRFLP